jgi:hypothetical protein
MRNPEGVSHKAKPLFWIIKGSTNWIDRQKIQATRIATSANSCGQKLEKLLKQAYDRFINNLRRKHAILSQANGRLDGALFRGGRRATSGIARRATVL